MGVEDFVGVILIRYYVTKSGPPYLNIISKNYIFGRNASVTGIRKEG